MNFDITELEVGEEMQFMWEAGLKDELQRQSNNANAMAFIVEDYEEGVSCKRVA